MTIMQDLAAGEAAVASFLVAEETKIVAWAKTGIPAVETAYQDLINDAKAVVTPLASAAESSLASEIGNVEADFETAIANFVQKISGGSAEAASAADTLVSILGAEGVTWTADTLEALVKPLFVKVLASIATVV